MSLESITLPTNKTETKISNNRRTIRSGEKGLSIKVTLVNADDQPYNLSDFSLEFNELKEARKVVIDDATGNKSGKFNIVDATGGVFEYTLAPDVYSASGKCWFVLKKDDQIIDTTKDFYFDVLQDATIHIDNDNYVSSLQAQIDMFEATVQKAKQDIGHTVTDLTKQITDTSNDLTHTSNQAKADALAAIKAAQDNATKTLNDLTSQYDGYLAKYNALEAKINADIKTINDNATAEINSIKSDWTTQAGKIDSDYKAQMASAIKDVQTKRDAAIADAAKKYQDQLTSFQNDYNSWKTKMIADFNAIADGIKKQITDMNTNTDALKKSLADTQQQVNGAIKKFADVDFTKFAKLTDIYSKDELKSMIDAAGKVKTVKGIVPDKNGDVPLPDPVVKFRKQYLDKNGTPQDKTWTGAKQSDGSFLIDMFNDDLTASKVKDLLNEKNFKVVQGSANEDLFSFKNSHEVRTYRGNGATIKNTPYPCKWFTAIINTTDNDFGYILYIDQTGGIYYNGMNGGVLNRPDWRKLATDVDLKNILGNAALDAPDFNSITDTGNYYISNPSNGKNQPCNSYGALIVFKSNNNRLVQVYYADSFVAPYYRMRVENAWNSWKQLVNTDLFNANWALYRPSVRMSDIFTAGTALSATRWETGNMEKYAQNLGDYGTGIIFGSKDTKGVLAVGYNTGRANITGGNTGSQWTKEIAWKDDITNLSNQLQAQSSTINDNKLAIANLKKNGVGFKPITQAEYDALSESEKANGMYAIGDSN